MILTKIHILRFVAALLLCAGAVSCSQNEPDMGQGEPLRPGQYPLTFVASVDGMASRAEGHTSWTDGDEIGIRIGDYPKVGHYMLNADGTVMSAVDALDWQTIAPSTVTAWYPYVELNQTKTIQMDDQTNGLDPYDFLTAKAENQIYTNTVKLSFKHQVSKIACKLVKGDGISDEEFQTIKVNIAGFTKASFSNGVLTGSYIDNSENNKWITPFYDTGQYDYEALVVPQDMRGKDFIKIDLTVNHNGNYIDKTLIYQPNDAASDLKAGTRYSYSVIVQKDRLEVKTLSAEWEDEGSWHRAEPAVFQVWLPNDEHLPKLSYSGNVEDKGDHLLVKGNRFDISYEIDSENVKKALQISGDSLRNVVTRYVEGNRYVFRYYILSEEVNLKYVDFVQVGDYYYSDGSWGPPELRDIKIPIGVVFKTGAGGFNEFLDKPENYGEDWHPINGYAVALNDAADGKIKWSNTEKVKVNTTHGSYGAEKTPYSGYIYTMNIKTWGETQGYNYDAVKAILDYEPKAPESSSGWYLPTIQQLIDIQNIPDRAMLFTDVLGTDLKSGTIDKVVASYWSCLEASAINIYVWRFDTGGTSVPKVSKSKVEPYVRAVLTF